MSKKHRTTFHVYTIDYTLFSHYADRNKIRSLPRAFSKILKIALAQESNPPVSTAQPIQKPENPENLRPSDIRNLSLKDRKDEMDLEKLEKKEQIKTKGAQDRAKVKKPYTGSYYGSKIDMGSRKGTCKVHGVKYPDRRD